MILIANYFFAGSVVCNTHAFTQEFIFFIFFKVVVYGVMLYAPSLALSQGKHSNFTNPTLLGLKLHFHTLD